MAKTYESEEQKKVIAWVRHHEENIPALRTLYHPASSYFGMGWGIIRWLQQLGVRKGVWDLHLPLDNGVWSCLWIEMKSPKGSLTAEQKEFERNIYASSLKTPQMVVCRTAEDAIHTIKAYLKILEEE
jgi:hypothetical protein